MIRLRLASPSPSPAYADGAGLRVGPWLVLAAFLGGGCAGPRLPDPKVTARAYAAAAERGDADAIYALLTPEGQRALGRSGTRQLVSESRTELSRNARGVKSEAARVEASAETRFSDGESATLVLEDGRFLVDAASLLPARPRTPSQALSGLRRALARRSYPALMALMTGDSQSALESDLGSLVSGLEHPETLDIQQSGDSAEVQLPTGHRILLKREAGIWRVLDFD
ncbi:MAG: hypothetical protein K0R38_7582 [Polyangiaceae bacterium]|jgi:hypothetical protein|nr:hypothetical protein [Polyangiaceae bacterium]